MRDPFGLKHRVTESHRGIAETDSVFSVFHDSKVPLEFPELPDRLSTQRGP